MKTEENQTNPIKVKYNKATKRILNWTLAGVVAGAAIAGVGTLDSLIDGSFIEGLRHTIRNQEAQKVSYEEMKDELHYFGAGLGTQLLSIFLAYGARRRLDKRYNIR